MAGSPIGAALARRPSVTSVASGRAYASVAQFPAGVASGDPTSDGVILWTRIDPVVAGTGIAVSWEVASDPAFVVGSVLASGAATTDAGADHTVHVDVSGLGAGTTAWYRFTVAGTHSPVGRTRTLPTGSVDHVRIAYFSCERFVHGWFNAHADLAARALDPATDVDLVICLGDYVYEAGPADGVVVAGRVDPEAPTQTLADYRRQYHLYKADLDLQAMHAAFPFVGIFDNHDGFSGPTDPAGPGARAAFFEQLPVRRSPADADRQYRSFGFGDLADLFLLDERQYRDPTPERGDNPLGTTTVEQPEMVAPGRTMLGADQKTWLADGLSRSTAAWKVLGSQLVVAPLRSEVLADVQSSAGDGPQRNAGRYVNLIGWDGYQAERRELLDHLRDEGIEDVLVLSGDSHFWTASELPQDWDDPDAPIVLVEFGGSSVTSANAGEQADLPGNELVRAVVAATNPYSLRFIEVETHGYGLLDLAPTGASATYVTTTITTRGAPASTLTRFEVDRGTARIRQVEGTDLLPRPTAVVPSPTDPATPPGAAVSADAVAGTPTYTG